MERQLGTLRLGRAAQNWAGGGDSFNLELPSGATANPDHSPNMVPHHTDRYPETLRQRS